MRSKGSTAATDEWCTMRSVIGHESKLSAGSACTIQALSFLLKHVYYYFMRKINALLLVLLVIAVVSFTTWQLFRGNLEAAYATFPFLLITYFFVKIIRK
jgi:hypothetical protein